jgi:phosphate-selective porin OprO/OprP
MQGSTRAKWVGVFLVCFLALGLVAGPVRAADDKILQEMKERLDRLEKQNDELRQKVHELSGASAGSVEQKEKEKVNAIVDSYLKDRDKKKEEEEKQKAALKEAEGFEVGKQLDAKARWNNYQLWFESEDKAFRLRLGGRTQIDAVWVHAPSRLQVPFSEQGIGVFDDAINFRRLRLEMEGTLWDVLDFKCEYDFANTIRVAPAGGRIDTTAGQIVGTAGTIADRNAVINTPVWTDMWIQWRDLPLIGNVRIGNQKQWISLEHLTSSRWLNYLERSMAFDAFVENGNNGFVPGIGIWRSLLDDNLFFGVGVYSPNFRDIFGWDVGDGERQYSARIAGTPIYQEKGRYLLHLGLGYLHSTADDGIIRYRARTPVRNGPAVLHNTVAQIQGQLSSYNLLVPELMVNCGPFTFSAEYYGAWVQQDRGKSFTAVGLQSSARDLPRGSRGQLFYQGGYAEVGYFLTGESRGYDRSFKCQTRQPCYENTFIVDGEQGLLVGRGAWQVLARYEYLDLDSEQVNGGILHGTTLGVNWFLNPNAKIQFNYTLLHRDATQYRDGRVAVDGNAIRDGLIQGFGTRFAFDF